MYNYIQRERDAHVGAKDYTPEVTRFKIPLKMPVKVRWGISVEIHWKSVNPLKHATENPLENATESMMISEVSISGVQSFVLSMKRGPRQLQGRKGSGGQPDLS